MRASGLIAKARTASPLAAAVLLTTAFALAPEPARAEPPEDAAGSYEEEVMFELTNCRDWQKVRRCATASGEVRNECVAKSPLAKFLSIFSDRTEDDEVRVEVIRRAPEPASAGSTPAPAAGEQAARAEVRQTQTKRVVKVKPGEKLPACRTDG